MRIPAFLRNLLPLLVLAAPVLVLAQFQKPTSEELKMTDDPKAPGAAAVFLNVEETTDDDAHYHSFYARIKVLQEKGKELATVEIPYWHGNSKVDDIKARTIHADGTVIPLTGKPEDLLAAKISTKDGDAQVNREVFNLPSVEVGCILEYFYKLRYNDFHFSSPTWDVQQQYYVHKAHYSFTPAHAFISGVSADFIRDHNGLPINSLQLWQILPSGVVVKQDAKGRFNLDLSDVPAMPKEDWMPPLQNFRYKVSFYYMNAEGSKDFWASEIKRWSAEVDRFAEPSKPIHEAVAGLVAAGDSGLDKARKLYKAVQALDNTDFSRKKSESELKQLNIKQTKTAQDIWVQKSGSSEEIALLYLAMLRAAGLSARAMKIADRDRNIFDPTYMSFGQLEDTIISLNIGGDEILLDPGEKMCPFQKLHWKHSNASGFLEGSDGLTPDHTPPPSYTDNNTTRKADITLDGQGGVQGALRLTMVGQQALHWRQIALRNDEDEVKKQFDRWLETIVPEGVEAHIDHFAGLDNPDVNLAAFVNVKGTLGTATGKRLLLPGFFFETRSRHPFVGVENRQEPVDMHYSEVMNDEVVYRFPAGMAVEGAPQDARISWPSKAILSTSSMPVHGQVTITRSLARAFTFVMKDQYQDLRDFYQKVASSDQQQVVLTASAAPKGN
jgi:hypothetical protein